MVAHEEHLYILTSLNMQAVNFKILWKDITKKRYCYLELNFPGLESSTQ